MVRIQSNSSTPVLQSQANPWLVQGLMPNESKLLFGNGGGGFKTILLNYLVTCVASGMPFLKNTRLQVDKGCVMIADEETPTRSLNNWRMRFALGAGKDLSQLPIGVRSKVGFKWRKETVGINPLIAAMKELEDKWGYPMKLLTIESVLKCIPIEGYKQLDENSSKLGVAISDDCDVIFDNFPGLTIAMSAHFGKLANRFSYVELRDTRMQDLVRGSGSIVEQGCDTGYKVFNLSVTKNESDNTPTKFILMPSVRRDAIPMGDLYVELQEPDGYGRGKASLVNILPETIPPSPLACELAKLAIPDVDQRKINTEAALHTREEKLSTVKELLENKIWLPGTAPLHYRINPNFVRDADPVYLKKLEEKNKAFGMEARLLVGVTAQVEASM